MFFFLVITRHVLASASFLSASEPSSQPIVLMAPHVAYFYSKSYLLECKPEDVGKRSSQSLRRGGARAVFFQRREGPEELECVFRQ